jgi:hypothetical protein
LKNAPIKKAGGLKKIVLVPRCHISNIIKLFDVWSIRFAPEDFKFCMGFAKKLVCAMKIKCALLVIMYENKILYTIF